MIEFYHYIFRLPRRRRLMHKPSSEFSHYSFMCPLHSSMTPTRW